MKKQSVTSFFRYLLLLTVGVGLLLVTVTTAWADGLSQGYLTADTQLKPGMVVALTADSTASNPAIERASVDNARKAIGLAVSASQNSIVISSGRQQVYVQTTGNSRGYVSDINGRVKKGDLLTVSPLKGIMMRAQDTDTDIVGVALEDMSLSSAERYTIQTDTSSKEALVSKISVNLDHKNVAGQNSGKATSTLAALGQAVTGRETSELRILIALVVFLLILVAEGGIIYGAVSNAISAVGRNPLASKLIRHELTRVLFVALFVLSLGAVIIYILLWT